MYSYVWTLYDISIKIYSTNEDARRDIYTGPLNLQTVAIT